MAIHHPSGYAFAGCPIDYMLMTDYMSIKYKPRSSLKLGGSSYFVSYNIKERKAIKLQTKGFPEEIPFFLHGIDLIQDPENEKLIHLLGINHRGNATDSIEHFKHVLGSNTIEYVESFQSECLYNMNDLIATSPTTFYYSQDISHISSPLFYMENIGLWPGGKVMYYGGKDDCRELAKGFKYANGIALSSDKSLLYVGETFRAKLHIFERDPDGDSPNIELKEVVPLKFIPDNFIVEPTSGHIYIAGFSSDIRDSLKFAYYDGVKNTETFRGVAARVVNETGEGRFFGRNYRVEPLFVDHGDTMFSTTVAVADETRGSLLLSGLFTKRGMLDCPLPEIKQSS